MTFSRWRERLLQALDAEPTPGPLAFLDAWAACEGGRAMNNPLNTTLRLPGSTRYNDAGVQNYADELQGLAALLLTLRLPYYDRLRVALGQPRNSARTILVDSHRDLITWGTGTKCIEARLRQR